LTCATTGAGGARPDGSGLLGLGDRLAVVDGRLEVQGPPGGGTRIAATIPLPSPRRGHRGVRSAEHASLLSGRRAAR
jgi:hypothetical protein